MEERIMKKFLLIMLLCAGFAGFVYADLSEGLVVRLDFEGDYSDSSGNGFDGIPMGTAAISEGVLALDGEGWVEIDIGDANPCAGTGDYTIAVAYACDNPAEGAEEENSVILTIGNPDGGYEGNDFGLMTNNDAQYIDIWGIAGAFPDQSGAGFSDGTMHWVVITYEAATGDMFFYVLDGSEAVEYGTAVLDYDTDYLGYIVAIGSTVNPDWLADMNMINLEGEIDAVAIYNRILTIDEMPGLPDAGGPGGLAAKNPIPENGAILVEFDTDISWEAHPDVNEPITFDVYFGTEPNELLPEWYGNTPIVTGTTDRTVLNSLLGDPPGDPLLENTTYYWRVDTHDPNNGAPILWEGRERSFTTKPVSVVITADPESATVPPGSTAEFTVEAINDETYQWYKSDTIDGAGTPVTDATSVTLTLTDVQLDDEGYYYCHITNAVPSEATSGRARLLTERVMVWYKFEDNADDSSITGEYDGVVANDPAGTPDPAPVYVTGIDGSAVDLDGIAQYVDVPHQVGPLTSATVTMWVNPDLDTADWDTNIALLHDDEWTEGDFHTILFPDEVGYDINGGVALWADNEAIVGEWLFVAFVYDTTGDVPVQQMYINGELAAEDESDI
jgi:hypothetical protein